MQHSLTTNPDYFSDDAWNLLLKSEAEAKRWRHEYLNVEHLLQTLFTDRELINIIQNLPINRDELLNYLEDFLANTPISTSGELFVGEELEELLDTANVFRTRWGSQLIEVSHLILALGRDKRLASELFEKLWNKTRSVQN